MTRKPKVPAPVAALIKAKALLERKGWVQCHGAVNAKGDPILPTSRAAAFCAAGALEAAFPSWDGGRKDARLLLGSALPSGYSLVGYNDTKGRTKAQILRLYDRAIALGLHWEKEDARAS